MTELSSQVVDVKGILYDVYQGPPPFIIELLEGSEPNLKAFHKLEGPGGMAYMQMILDADAAPEAVSASTQVVLRALYLSSGWRFNLHIAHGAATSDSQGASSASVVVALNHHYFYLGNLEEDQEGTDLAKHNMGQSLVNAMNGMEKFLSGDVDFAVGKVGKGARRAVLTKTKQPVKGFKVFAEMTPGELARLGRRRDWKSYFDVLGETTPQEMPLRFTTTVPGGNLLDGYFSDSDIVGPIRFTRLFLEMMRMGCSTGVGVGSEHPPSQPSEEYCKAVLDVYEGGSTFTENLDVATGNEREREEDPDEQELEDAEDADEYQMTLLIRQLREGNAELCPVRVETIDHMLDAMNGVSKLIYG